MCSPRRERRAAAARRAPPARQRERYGLERLRAHDVFPAVRREQRPACALETVGLERAREWIDEPEERDTLARVHGHLAHPVEPARRGRDHLAHEVGRQREPRHVGNDRHALGAPSSHVGHEHVLSEVELRFHEKPPSAGSPVAASRARECGSDVDEEPALRHRMRRGGTRAREELPVDDLRDEVIGHLPQIVVRGAGAGRLTHGDVSSSFGGRHRGLPGPRGERWNASDVGPTPPRSPTSSRRRAAPPPDARRPGCR